LAIPGLLFVQSFLKLNNTVKVLLQRAIMLIGYHHCVDRLQEVVVHDLFPGHLILALEDIFKLVEGFCPVEVNVLGPLVEIRDGFVSGKFDAKSTTVEMDLRFQFIEALVLFLHLVHLLWEVFLVEGLFEKSQR
jgi:hypothetical protein